MSEAKLPAKQNGYDSKRAHRKKSLLYSCDDLNRMAEQSYRARLVKKVSGPEEELRSSYEKCFLEHPNVATQHDPQAERKKMTAYPNRVGLRWNPCVEVSSGEEMPTHSYTRKPKPNCNCANCTSLRCPSKNSSTSLKAGFRDNIMTFSDKTTMTPRLNHASCSARTPIISPRTSDASVTASPSQTEFRTGYYVSQNPKPIFKKPCLRPDDFYERKQRYEEAVKHTDVHEDCPILRNAYSRHRVSHSADTQYVSGKINLYNEGISDKVAERYPVHPPYCPHKIRYGSRAFCRNKCPDCRCIRPTSKNSKYHHRCSPVEYNGPVYYDIDPEEMQHFVAVPSIIADRYVTPVIRPSRGPSIILPKKVLTSERDIDAFVQEERNKLGQRYKISK